MRELPAEFVDLIRRIAADTVARSAPSRGEFAALAAAVRELAQARLSDDDQAALALALPALGALRAGVLVNASEVIALALADRSDAGARLQHALAPYLAAASPAHKVGRLLTRGAAAGACFDGWRLRRIDGPRNRDPGLYVVEFVVQTDPGF